MANQLIYQLFGIHYKHYYNFDFANFLFIFPKDLYKLGNFIINVFGKKIEKSLTSIIDDKAAIYDEQIDKFYNETHIGGFTYRHFERETGISR